MLEIVTFQRSPAPGVQFNDGIIKVLCATGDLKGIQAEGTVPATAVGPAAAGGTVRPVSLWGHFEPPSTDPKSNDFLCSDLPD